jgi:outer membrane protein insertion porin family/translocation and assembly module TamA
VNWFRAERSPACFWKPGALGVLALLAVAVAGCHPTGDVQVKSIDFTGVDAFPVGDLKSVLATRESGRFPWSPKHYFDQKAFDADLQRIHAYYADRGYPSQRVTNVEVTLNETKTEVRLRIDVDEGQPVVVDTVRFEGFDVLPDDVRRQLETVPLRSGAPRDRTFVRVTRDLAAGLFHDNGYPFGFVDTGERPGQTANSVIVTFRGDAGEPMQFGDAAVDGLNAVNPAVVRHGLAFKPGDTFRQSLVTRTQRRLSAIEVFDLATVSPRFDEAANGRVPLHITVAEGKPRRIRFGVGYGTEERARGSVNWEHLNVMGGARRFEAEARASYLDQRLRLSFVEPYLMRPGWSLNLSALAERTQQLTYDARSYGATATVNYHLERGGSPAREPVRYDVDFGYRHEFLSFGIRPEFLGDLSQRDERIALGLDPETGRGSGTLAALRFDVQRASVDDVLQPRRGTVASLHLEHAAPWLAGTYEFTEVLIDGRAYLPVGRWVIANRAMFGVVSAEDSSKVPFSKRYFLGGATSLRGWGRYQVSPLDEEGLPIGGRTLVEFSSELRFPITGKLSGAFFVDAGSVGGSDWNVEGLRVRANVGPALSYQTPIGPVRADIGFQLTPIEGLVVNGRPEARNWRLHVSIGHPF